MKMTRMRIILLAVTMLTLGTNAFGDELSPNEILQKVVATYEALRTYKAEGIITSHINTGGMDVKIETSFSILLEKPNLYLIFWTQSMPISNMTQSGAVWSDGTQPYLYMGIMNSYSKMSSDASALSSATGISSGAAFTMPSLFLSVFKEQDSPFFRLKDPKVEKIEKVGEEDCYVLSGPSTVSKKEIFWISKASYLIRKYYRSIESPEEDIEIPEMTDEQLVETIKAMGQEVTEESKKMVRSMMENAKEMRKTKNMKGFFVEFYTNISFPELSRSDFNFVLPEDTEFKDSLFSDL